ncbi:hypothetical protein KR074_007425 [Drosophila pseudoananassae]|nr:hypothetical protein KR074_007425 [Drosophila pseudoananassae]
MLSLNYPNYLLIVVFVFGACEPRQLEEVAFKSLDCRQNICLGLDFPNSLEVARFTKEVAKSLEIHDSLILHSSHLANFPRNVFPNLPQLAELDVLECKVQEIERQCFEGSRNLRRLNLGGNLIKDLEENAFELATELEELNLSDNQMEDLPAALFLPLKKLQKINLSSNNIKTMSPVIFSQLKSLKFVSLDGNLLRELPSDLFRDQRKQLTEFSAKSNHLERFSSNIIVSIQRLSLSGNFALRRLQLSADIDQLQATNCGLESVALSGRAISVQLEDNPGLKELQVSQPEHLEQLYLANTNLTRLDFLSRSKNLVDLDVSGIDNLSDLPQITASRELERLSFTYDNKTLESMDMLPELKNLNYLEISHDKGKEVFIKDLDADFFVDHAEVNCGQLAELLELVDLPRDTTIVEDRVVGDPRGPLRCGV